jgi:hypothetical protein
MSKLKSGLKVKHEDIGAYKPVKKHRKKAVDRKYSPKANKKIHQVIREFEEGDLHSGSKKGPKVTNLRQALAIGISTAKRKGFKAGEKWSTAQRKKRKKIKQ